MKETILDKVAIFLLKKGFIVKNLTRTCFDILARRGMQILLIKILEDANSITRQYTDEMNSITSYINAAPIIVAEKAGGELDDNIVYSRFDIYTLNYNTFVNAINHKMPFIRRSQAGLTASVVGEKLKEKRERLGYSLNALSRKLGVTSRMIMKYENENSEVTINRAMKIYDLFGHQVFNEIDIFMKKKDRVSKFESPISRKYIALGFDATETKKTPFDIISRKDDDVILTELSDKVNPQMESVSKLLDADNLVIFKRKKPKNIPSMTKKEFMEFEKANELVKWLKEF